MTQFPFSSSCLIFSETSPSNYKLTMFTKPHRIAVQITIVATYLPPVSSYVITHKTLFRRLRWFCFQAQIFFEDKYLLFLIVKERTRWFSIARCRRGNTVLLDASLIVKAKQKGIAVLSKTVNT